MLNTIGETPEDIDMYIWKSVPEDAIVFTEASKEVGIAEYRYKNFHEIEELVSGESFCFLITEEGVFFSTQEKKTYSYGKLVTMICVGRNRFVPMRHPNKERPIKD